MSLDGELSKKVETYQNLAKENPNIDVGLLMMNALQTQKQNVVSAKFKRWAYLISISVPPFGILFALKLFWGDEDDARQTAWICVILTAVSLLFYWMFGKVLLSGTGTSFQQIQQIKPSDIRQLTQ